MLAFGQLHTGVAVIMLCFSEEPTPGLCCRGVGRLAFPMTCASSLERLWMHGWMPSRAFALDRSSRGNAYGW